MGPPVESAHAYPKRQPLGDATLRANIAATPSRSNKKGCTKTPPRGNLPHHESVAANGALTVRNATTSPQNKRISAVTNEGPSDSKRDSQISTTSTNASSKGVKRKTHIGPWELGNGIGRGCVGKVRKVRHSATGQIAAAKIISKRVAEKARAESLMSLVEKSKNVRAPGVPAAYVMPFGIEREIVIMKLLEHPNVVKLYDIWENREEMYLIMEYVDGGELFEYITQRGLLNEDETIYLFRQAVAALLHCHRIGIHHRDLKPENILLERDTLQLKIADFGMAALQPKGTLLNTPCGSVHYAAPEVFEKNYDGGKADVWSLGVILYVMLTGSTPFQHGREMEEDVMRWYRLLKSGRFPVYEYMSKEAIDLVRRMLAPEARNRITLEAVWRHPLLHKYEKEWGESPESGRIENWVGPRLVIDSWKLQEFKDIDRALLRSLLTLWHHQKEEVIIERLLNKEPNQEKYFYSALSKYQDEQLENYIGPPDGVSYSGSDYHHLKPVEKASEMPPIPRNPHINSKSTYSILNEDNVRKNPSISKSAPSEESYDPFRSSKNAIVTEQANYNVTVHRGSSKNSQQRSPRRPGSLRVHALRKEQRRMSRNSSTSSVLKIVASPIRNGAQNKSISRASLTGSQPGSPPVAVYVKHNTAHKRGVDFSAVRRSSTASRLKTPETASLSGEGVSSNSPEAIDQGSPYSPASASTPALGGNVQVRSKKESIPEQTPRARPRNYQTHSQVIEYEARKVSTELEKFCQDAFFRESNGSTSKTDGTQSQSAYETPPSSAASNAPLQSLSQQTASGQRGLLDASNETPNTFINRELAEARKKIAARYITDESAQNTTYQQIIAQLDALLKPGTPTASQLDGRRVASAPEARFPEYSGLLPVINEENKFADAEESMISNVGASTQRPNPNIQRPGNAQAHQNLHPDTQSTIRFIPSASQPRIPPLVIRKTSGLSDTSQTWQTEANRPDRFQNAGYHTLWNTRTSSAQPSNKANDAFGDNIISLQQVESKKKHWFRRGLNNAVKQPRSIDDDDDNHQDYVEDFSAGIEDRLYSQNGRDGSDSERRIPAAGEKRPGFLRFFGRKRNRKPNHHDPRMMLGGEDDERDSVNSYHSDFQPTALPQRSTAALDDRDPRDLGVQRSWFARFLHIKPASKILCFNTTRGKARGEIGRLFKRWRMYGIRDVVTDREKNLVFARLSSANHLGIREVSFVVELFVVLEHGRRAHLSIARFTQQKGAASSFKRVVDTVEEVLNCKGLIVDDIEMRQEMESILA